jgi:nitrogen fixation NifU-like protein
MTNEIYRARILDHFQHPRHRGSLEGMQWIGRAAIPMCGDEVEVGVREAENERLAVRFRGRGCAVCIASASMMTEIVNGLTRGEADEIAHAFRSWILRRTDAERLTTRGLIETFAAVREGGSRARCAALPWDALGDALVLCAAWPQEASGVGVAESAVAAPSAPG